MIPESYVDTGGYVRKITIDPNGIPRDQWKRPVIRRADGTWRGYTRISTIAKELDKGEGLKKWTAAMTALGVTMDEAIRRRVEEIVAFSEDPYREHKTELLRLAEQAQEIAGSTVKRELGTTLHEWCQIVDREGDLSLVPAEHLADVTAYRRRLEDAGIEVLESEVFVVNDEIEVAGSLDKRLRLADGRIVTGDVKTGQQEPEYPMNVELQVAAYNRGERYDLQTTERTPLGTDPELGVLIHLPSNSGTCELYPLNLTRGWQNLMLATDLKLARKVAGRKLSPLNLTESRVA